MKMKEIKRVFIILGVVLFVGITLLSIFYLPSIKLSYHRMIELQSAITACKNIEAADNYSIADFPKLKLVVKDIVKNDIPSSNYRIIKSELAAYSYQTKATRCQVEIEFCTEKSLYDLCQTRKVNLYIDLQDWKQWAQDKQFFQT